MPKANSPRFKPNTITARHPLVCSSPRPGDMQRMALGPPVVSRSSEFLRGGGLSVGEMTCLDPKRASLRASLRPERFAIG